MKAGSRVLINTSPEPFTNWTASVSEDIAVFGGLWAALHHPWVFLGLLVVFIILMIWLLPKIWSAIKSVFAWLGRLFGGEGAPSPVLATANGASPEWAVESEVAADPPANGDGLGKIARLKELFDSGALTKEEFNVEKAKILK
jgi:hypothetical protein